MDEEAPPQAMADGRLWSLYRDMVRELWECLKELGSGAHCLLLLERHYQELKDRNEVILSSHLPVFL